MEEPSVQESIAAWLARNPAALPDPMTLPIGKARKIRKPDGTPKVRRNFWLANGELLREMAGGWNFSWFLDELIAREYRRREKSTQSKNDSALT